MPSAQKVVSLIKKFTVNTKEDTRGHKISKDSLTSKSSLL
ncbi:MAG: hypothetical protein ACI9CD_000475, partial [Candidatus Deianiraeaceae bacterium]